MKLPLNIFQILGANPGASANTILMILEKRLGNCPYTGFSSDSLKERDKLLREYGKILLSATTKEDINTISDLDSAMFTKQITIPSDGYAIAGLILLLEADMPSECLTLASELMLKTPRQISKSGHIQADLNFLIGYASIEQSNLFKQTRHYEHSAQILEKSLSLMEPFDCNQLVRAKINEKLDDLLPFRILDLLSRNTEDQARFQGIDLLQRIVRERGGLDNESNLYIESSEFKAFFRQIRCHLTVQEQINLFQQWKCEGSKAAHFLLAIALVASGFSQRKPQRLAEALSLMNELSLSELNNTISYLHLLLGKVQQAEKLYASSNPDGSIQHNNLRASFTANEVLGRLCESCKEWLATDVLEGYRDIEIDADLEAFFNDKDVTTFIEKQDAKERQSGFIQGIIRPIHKSHGFNKRADRLISQNIPNNHLATLEQSQRNIRSSFAQIFNILLKSNYSIAMLILSIAVFLYIFTAISQRKNESSSPNKMGSKYNKVTDPHKKEISSKPRTVKFSNKSGYQLNKQEIQELISTWLKIKSNTLAGMTMPETAELVASFKAVSNLKAERDENNRKGEILHISVNVLDLDVLERSEDKIVVSARLLYSDQRMGRSGNIIEATPKHVFKKTYRLVTEGDMWKVE